MEISFLGKTSVRLKTKNLTFVTDPVTAKEKADVVLYCGGGEKQAVAGAVNRDKVFVIDKEGEYELAGVGVVNYGTAAMITMDGINVGYISGDLAESQIDKLKDCDVILVPIASAVTLINQIEPYIAVLIGYEKVGEINKFLDENKFESVKRDSDKLRLDADSLPENTEIVVLNA